ncbi:MAG: putative oxidoreductase [Chloroflexi bacterium]|nr:putative oxidoreductase [Chloroflexota bacterium]MDB5077930.1 putative oxidoreductase [Chloroflexota bacterium]
MADVRIGLIGAGTVGGWHLTSYQRAGATIVAVADPNEQLGRGRAAEYGSTFYQDYREMLAAEQLDAVSVCTPPHLHREHALTCMDHGLHVLCEKPFAASMEDARAMVAAAEQSDRVLQVGFVHRFYEPAQRARQYGADGTLGTLISFHNRFAVNNRQNDRDWVLDPRRAGGGTYMDTAMHSVDLFRFVIGEIVAVSAHHRTVAAGMPVEDTGVLVVRSETGVLGVIEADWMTPVTDYTFAVYGTDGAVKVGYDPAELLAWTRQTPTWQRESLESDDAMARFDREIDHFLQCVQGKATPAVTAYDGLRALEVIQAAYESAATRTEVPCSPA